MDTQTYQRAVALRHTLHQYPCLSNQEQDTKQRLMTFLRAHTSLELCDRGDWFYAAYRTDPARPKIAFRADMDALPIQEPADLLPYASQRPGISHKCGHDGHCATLAAFALEVDRLRPQNNLFFLFQPAEETGDGAKRCAAFLEQEHIDAIYGYHNWPGPHRGAVMLREGTLFCASKGLSLFFHGAASHASEPEQGRNPAFAIAKLIDAIPALCAPQQFEGFVLCTVIHVEIGAVAFGTSAGEGVLRLTIRAEHEQELQALQQRLQARALELAQTYGLQLETAEQDVFPQTKSWQENLQQVRAACEALQIPLEPLAHPIRSSEDFGVYTNRTKGAFFCIDTGPGPALHTAQYDFPDAIIPQAVALFSRLAGMDRTPADF